MTLSVHSRSITSLMLVAGALLGPAQANAQNETLTPAEWTGEASLGFVDASGNSDNTTASGTLDLKRKSRPWTQNFSTEVYRLSGAETETNNRFLAAYKLERKLTERMFAWGSARYERDEVIDIENRYAALAGLGFDLWTGPPHALTLEPGVGFRRTEFAAAGQEEEAVGSLDLRYQYKANDRLSFSQTLGMEYGQSNTLATAKSQLRVALIEQFSLSLTYALRHNSDIVGERGKKTDGLFTVSLIYGF